MDLKNNIRKYAKLIVEVGVNIQPNQYLMINSPTQTAEFARYLTEYAYQSGAKKVYVNFSDEELARTNYEYAPDEAFLEYPSWDVACKDELVKKNCAFISISASNPELLKGIEPQKISTNNKTRGKALANYRKHIQNGDVAWCVVCVPTPEWSKKVFPNFSEEEAINALWDKIFIATRVYEKNPTQAWNKHIENLTKYKDKLNSKKIKTLHYLAPNTDLVVELSPDHIWAGGCEHNKANVAFVANMPTEEIFTMPDKYGINGKLSSTKPLNYGGNLIDEFTLYFEAGRIVKFTAKEGYDSLKELIETDEGSHYLGEVAIVPFTSAVANTNTLFYNTLFDENASCHFAIGSAYPENIKGGKSMSDEELEKAKANVSLEHEDFMVGSNQLDIIATTFSGDEFYVLKKGEWAF